MTIRVAIPPPDVTLRSWTDTETGAWKKLTDRASKASRSAGRSAGFEVVLAEARKILATRSPAADGRLDSRRMKRAVMTVWAEDSDIAEHSLREDVFNRVAPLEDGRSTLLSLSLATVYYKYFDLLDDWEDGLFATVGTRLVAFGRRQRSSGSANVFTALTQHRKLSVGPHAPARIAARIREKDTPLRLYLERSGMVDYQQGQFGARVLQATYLDRIAHADPCEEHDFLAELNAVQLKKAPMPDRRMFGHAVIEAMTKTDVSEPHPTWRNTIIDIAGDPRARGTTEWSTWWALVDEECKARVIAWLATQDLQLFLDAVEAYGEREGDADLIRMFRDRKHLLQGLHRQGFVRETRLLAANEARSSIRLQLGSELRTEITPLFGIFPDLSVIFLDCGDFHIVEGSHNFKLRVFIGDRPREFTTWSKARFHVSELRNPAYQEGSLHKAFTHHSSAKWIADALMFLAEHGINIPPEALMTPETYELVNLKFELPVQKGRKWR